MLKIVNYIFHPTKVLLYFSNKGCFKFVNDSIYLKMKYKLVMHKKLNLNNPKTYNEKLQWLKLNEHNKLHTIMADKYLVRQYISDIIGSEYLIPLIGVYDTFDDINFDNLPNQFVIKPNHTSGDVYICEDKSTINLKKLKKIINGWLKRDYYSIHREWPYKNIKRKIIIEKYMGYNLTDYKFMCFNGNMKCSFTCTDRNSSDGLHVTFFDRNFNVMPFVRKYPKSQKIITKPLNYEKMVVLAEKLSSNINFLRVDFYEINKKIYFGELTFFPGSGYEKFDPEEYDNILGDWLKIDLMK